MSNITRRLAGVWGTVSLAEANQKPKPLANCLSVQILQNYDSLHKGWQFIFERNYWSSVTILLQTRKVIQKLRHGTSGMGHVIQPWEHLSQINHAWPLHRWSLCKLFCNITTEHQRSSVNAIPHLQARAWLAEVIHVDVCSEHFLKHEEIEGDSQNDAV